MNGTPSACPKCRPRHPSRLPLSLRRASVRKSKEGSGRWFPPGARAGLLSSTRAGSAERQPPRAATENR